MKVKELMTGSVICVSPEESVAVASRIMARNNIGALPVCWADGRLCGMVTDRDLVTRCVAAGRNPGTTTVREIMTGQVFTATAEMDAGAAAHLMGRRQVRRLPVTEQGKLCGMVSLGDLSRCDHTAPDATDALAEISANITGLGSGTSAQ